MNVEISTNSKPEAAALEVSGKEGVSLYRNIGFARVAAVKEKRITVIQRNLAHG